jgi:transposase
LYAVTSTGEVVLNASEPNDWEALDKALRRCPGRIMAAVEAGCNWPWLVYGLQERGCEVRLLHPNSVRVYRQTRAKNDRLDAALLAQLAAEPWRAKSAWICPGDWLWVRAQLRARQQLVETRTSIRNRVHALLKQDNRRGPVQSLFGPTGYAWLAGLHLPAAFRQTLDGLLAVETELSRQIDRFEQALWPMAKHEPLMRRIAELPQAGPYTAVTIALESGDLARFRGAGAYNAHCGLTPWSWISAGKSRGGGLCPLSSQALKDAYAEWGFRLLTKSVPGFAQVAASYRDHPTGEAKIMLARKLAPAVRAMAVRGEDFVVRRLVRNVGDVA